MSRWTSIPTSHVNVKMLYMNILREARKFPSVKRDGIVKEIMEGIVVVVVESFSRSRSVVYFSFRFVSFPFTFFSHKLSSLALMNRFPRESGFDRFRTDSASNRCCAKRFRSDSSIHEA